MRFMESKNTTSLFLQGDERGSESETETDRQTDTETLRWWDQPYQAPIMYMPCSLYRTQGGYWS